MFNFKIRKILMVVFLLMTTAILPGIFAFADGATDAEASDADGGKMRNFRASPFIVPVYTPEMGFLLAAGGLFSFSTDPDNEILNRSNLNIMVGYSATGSLTANSLWKTYWLEDKLRVNLDLWFKDMPDNYWGVGYENGRHTQQGDQTTSYQRLWWQINPQLLYEVYNDLFLGMNLDFNQTVFSDMSPGVESDPQVQEYGTRNYNGGVGIILLHDSRDMPENAYTGWYLSGSATFYGSYLGSNNTYQIFETDYRQYQQIVRPGSTLAWQLYSRIGTGFVPYAEVTQMGNPWDLRGYYWGRFRDRTGLFALVEYRFKFMQYKPNRLRPDEGRKESRHGFVTWAGIGWIGNNLGDLRGHHLPNIGFGYRFELQSRLNVRVDFGWGVDSSGIYFNFTEAF
jgi:hypothetical protein